MFDPAKSVAQSMAEALVRSRTVLLASQGCGETSKGLPTSRLGQSFPFR